MGIGIHRVLAEKFKGRKYSLSGENIADIIIFDNLGPITQSMIDVAEVALIAEDAATLYRRQRAAEYPLITDQLDMLWHSMDSGEIQKSVEFYNACKAVKDKYPKPQ